jgi:hypothetical protein
VSCLVARAHSLSGAGTHIAPTSDLTGCIAADAVPYQGPDSSGMHRRFRTVDSYGGITPQSDESERRHTMLYPLILWLLGVPVVLIILLMLLGVV